MKKDISLKQRLISSVLVLVMLFTSLLGTTFAWFTDDVTSRGNTIQSGSVKVDLLHMVDDNWVSLKENPSHKVFDYDKWEPGFTAVEVLKVANLGSLALRYRLSVEVADDTAVTGKNGENLADVIDVYVMYGESTATSLGEITSSNTWIHKGTLSEVMKNPASFMGGQLLPTGEIQSGTVTEGTAVGSQTISIALHMQESAGNEYQELSVGDIYVNLLATQWSYENDSFGSDYDNGVTFPSFSGDYTASAPVEVNGDNTLKNEVVLKSDEEEVSAKLPEGVLLLDGVNTVTLTVSSLDDSESNIEVSENQVMNSVDVHISGIAAGNTAPILVTVKELLANGLNMGNYELYHVENGTTVAMTYVASSDELDAHNEFTYDPATGDVTMALCSFSEIALVSDTENAWAGEYDYSWYDVGASELYIANADQLAAFGAIVGGMNGYTADSFADKTVTLLADINLGDKDNANESLLFYPIGYYNNTGRYEKVSGKVTVDGEEVAVSSYYQPFTGTFDGNGNTIANFYQNTWEMFGDYNDGYSGTPNHSRDGMGLFGKVYGGTVKNLTVEGFSSDGEFATTGVIAAYAEGATFENIAITNCNPRVYNIGNGGIVGCVGWYAKEAGLKTTFTNITVDNTNKISALWGSWDVACGGILGQYYPTSGQTSAGKPANGGIDFVNCHVAAQIDVYNDVCANYQYYAYRYAGMLIGSVRENETVDGHVYPKMDGITASGCTVHFGTWNDYYYCELVANSLASYTHDHQFSRLTQVASIDVENKTVTGLDGNTTAIPTSGRYNYVVVNGEHATENATCYHFVDGAVWNHANAGTETVDGVEGVLKEDKQHIYLEFNNLVTGYGWGVTSRSLTNLNGVTNLDVSAGNQDSSVEKFEDAGYSPKDYRPGETITIGDLFNAKDGATINKDSVYVSVSAIVDGETVIASFALDENDWTKSTITFGDNCNGTAKVTITDYIFCTPTVIYLNLEQAVEKFTPNSVSAQNAYTQITLGTLFGLKDSATIGNVTATVTDPNGNKTTVTGTSSDWTDKTIDLIKEGPWTVAIKDDDAFCAATETTFTVNKVDKFNKLFDKDFLYRVGNQNTVTLGTIFSEIATDVALSSVNITIENVEGNAAGTFTSNATWTDGTIQVSGTGVVKVTISADGANAVELQLEIVNATNLTSATGYSGSTEKTYVIVKDVNASEYVYYYNCTLYGNGFTYSLNGAPTTYSSSHGHGVIMTKNATFDNLVIVGDVYDEYGAYTGNNDYNAAIDVLGDTVIRNCYISGCSAPISARANATITNTTLYGGAVANLLIKGGTITLENVTTANYNDGRFSDGYPVGMGIVVHSDASETAKLVLNGTLTQYNFLNEEDTPTDTYAKNLHTAMFGTSLSQYHFGTSPNRRVNTGIVSLTATFNAEDITDNANTGYSGTSVTLSGVDGYVYTQLNTIGSVNNGYDMDSDSHVATTQGAVPPSYSFDHTVNYIAKEDGSNDYCYEENGTVYVSMDDGDTFTWSTSILTLGKGLTEYTVSMNGTDYTGKSIVFNTAGNYEVVYTYIDGNNYTLDEGGNIITYEQTYTKTVSIYVSVIKDTTKHAEFTFGSSGTESKSVTIGNNTYIMPNVTGTSDTIGSITVDETTVYYTLVDAYTSDGSTEHSSVSSWYMCYPVFKNVITITDYESGGTGNAVTYSSSTTTMPSGLSLTAYSQYFSQTTAPSGTVNFTTGGADTAFKYQASNSASSTPTTLNSVLIYASPTLSDNARDELYLLVQYKYQDNAGATYYYYVGYHMPQTTVKTICVTGDTLVTLADGSQKRIDQVTYSDQILVWNFYAGEYATVGASHLINHGYAYNDLIALTFSDGTVIKVLNQHGFFDVDLNEFVSITASNANDYIGHKFIKQEGTVITLNSCSLTTEYIESYSILTTTYYNCYLEGVLSLTPPETTGNYFMPFEVGENMTFDADMMQADIEKYGLFTYEEFADRVSEDVFYALNAPYMKVAIGKGIITMEEFEAIVDALADKEFAG